MTLDVNPFGRLEEDGRTLTNPLETAHRVGNETDFIGFDVAFTREGDAILDSRVYCPSLKIYEDFLYEVYDAVDFSMAVDAAATLVDDARAWLGENGVRCTLADTPDLVSLLVAARKQRQN